MIIGGAMACTFFKAMGLETGKSLVEADRVDMAKDLLRRGGDKLLLPVDAVVSTATRCAAAARTSSRATRFPRAKAMFDIGPESCIKFTDAITEREDRGVERADGRVRDAGVRLGHASDRDGDGESDGARAPRRSSAAATPPRQSPSSGSSAR